MKQKVHQPRLTEISEHFLLLICPAPYPTLIFFRVNASFRAGTMISCSWLTHLDFTSSHNPTALLQFSMSLMGAKPGNSQNRFEEQPVKVTALTCHIGIRITLLRGKKNKRTEKYCWSFREFKLFCNLKNTKAVGDAPLNWGYATLNNLLISLCITIMSKLCHSI